MTKETEDDDLFVAACARVREEERASNTFLQAAFGIGTGRARKLLARMEAAGVISAADERGARVVFGITASAAPAAAPAPTSGSGDQSPAEAPKPASAPPMGPEEGVEAPSEYQIALDLVRANAESFGTSFLQRRMGIGYNAAARLIERMEDEGVISRANAVGKRTLLPARDPSNPFAPTERPGWIDPPGKAETKKGEMRMDDVTEDGDDEDRFGNGKPKNVQAPGSNVVTGEELRAFFERIEQVRGDKKKLSAVESEIFAEMKSRGYDTKVARSILKIRSNPPDAQAEFDAVSELYLAAVGMLREPPLFRHLAGMGVDPLVKDSVVAALKMIAPIDGDITIKAGSGPRLRISRTKDGVFVEEVSDAPWATTGKAGEDPSKPAAPPVPDVDEDRAFLMGKEARKENVPVVQNPFPFGDPRRRHWDEGWREQDGGDGFGGGAS
ncbi:hypothetical protein RCHOTPOCKET_61 [Rhodobacter phage RcHotPocket]|nr:hypothetical protein RCHOTPOCKET_61 [Rhodobacter phage RcHotPocket]